jgi:hypothetical protein
MHNGQFIVHIGMIERENRYAQSRVQQEPKHLVGNTPRMIDMVGMDRREVAFIHSGLMIKSYTSSACCRCSLFSPPMGLITKHFLPGIEERSGVSIFISGIPNRLVAVWQIYPALMPHEPRLPKEIRRNQELTYQLG